MVCAATWLMPAALVARSWDFADPPRPVVEQPNEDSSSPLATPTRPESAAPLESSADQNSH